MASWDALHRLPGSARLSPLTSSVGRLFDGLAALAGLQSVNRFEGQAAMALEHAAEGQPSGEAYPLPLTGAAPRSGGGGPWVLDWAPTVEAALKDLDRGAPAARVSARFHGALAAAIVEAARRAGLERVVLSGGVFQNARLTEDAVRLLEKEGFRVHTPQRIPCNDGGISTGQAYLAGLGWGIAEKAYVSGNPGKDR